MKQIRSYQFLFGIFLLLIGMGLLSINQFVLGMILSIGGVLNLIDIFLLKKIDLHSKERANRTMIYITLLLIASYLSSFFISGSPPSLQKILTGVFLLMVAYFSYRLIPRGYRKEESKNLTFNEKIKLIWLILVMISMLIFYMATILMIVSAKVPPIWMILLDLVLLIILIISINLKKK